MPDKPLRYFALSVGLTAVFLCFLLQVNAGYLFHSRLYEDGDLGANSLSVLRAEHFDELFGQYSRWGFHHPGPGVLYGFALGEGLLYRTFHVVPTGYNAQLIALMALVCSFLAAGISVAARWVRGVVFVPLALLFAALHFTSAEPLTWVLLAWMPYVMTLLFFGLLIGAASVGAGQGDDLPLLALGCGFMVHIHVAQPLFVVPLFLVAYAGLAWSCYRQPAEGAAARPPWRVFPRAHSLAAALVFAFVLPIIVDLFRGSESNLAAILRHMHAHKGNTHPWLDALYCFVRFGAYNPSHATIGAISPGRVTPGQIGAFLLHHLEMTALWLGALCLPIVALVLRRRKPPLPDAPDAVDPARWRWRFLGWLAAVWLLSGGWTLAWGHIGDGELFYYNSWFTYSIYYVLALLAAGALSDIVERLAARGRRPLVWTTLASVLCVLGTVGYTWRNVHHYRADAYRGPANQAQAQTTLDALAAHPAAPRAKLLIFPGGAWETATGIAVLLTREGYPCLVPSAWDYMFGHDHVRADLFDAMASAPDAAPTLDIWRIVPVNTVDPAYAAAHPLNRGFTLLPGGPEVDPAGPGATITFAGPLHNSDACAVTGWADPDPGASYTWSVGKQGILSFAPKPVPPGAAVEVDLYCPHPYLAAGKRDSQRITLRFNGHDLGTLQLAANTFQPLKVSIPAALWNQQPSALLVLGFPDAISPKEAGENEDARPIGVGTDKIIFRLAE